MQLQTAQEELRLTHKLLGPKKSHSVVIPGYKSAGHSYLCAFPVSLTPTLSRDTIPNCISVLAHFMSP